VSAQPGTGAHAPSRLGAFTVWQLRSTEGGSTGLEFARAAIDPSRTVLVHAAPTRLAVEVLANGEHLIAIGRDLRPGDGDGDTPMTRLVIDGTRVLRSQLWPEDADLGSVVLLPGGEAGVLQSWATDPDRSSWTWSLELRGRAP
jgi:hypothetical protein